MSSRSSEGSRHPPPLRRRPPPPRPRPPDIEEIKCGPARLGAPDRSIIMEDGPARPYGEDLRLPSPPDAPEVLSRRARLSHPGRTVVKEDRAPVADGEHT